ncbi:helix-turn-helix domain-containing protein [Zunongwangia sp. HGR-M22]|uniref:helix-turn-helix domain-containing protein n=1 Tax=Zunongwangia sp. HGR-M22 TaxID=3015168 RepID=UPI0022DD091F|nr:response regulator transcription factor [Zunongwangia sp. HGR-M22]WBL24293.1 helix-turn-helix transcriptional regulator [Zunongwangia sp. HGR-M22]
MVKKSPYRFNTISEYHTFRGLPAPEHPLISVINFDDIKLHKNEPDRLVSGFYTIALKRHPKAKLKYGQQEYDFDDGVMLFMAPEQVFGIKNATNEKPTGWMLMLHPDFLWKTKLANSIHNYEYFDYAINEALFLSKKEEVSITKILKIIQLEYHGNIDQYSHKIIIAQLDLLFSYAERYYNRQFLIRRKTNHQILSRLENLLNHYFAEDILSVEGLPTVQKVANQINLSPKYLTGLLKNVTGKSTQEHIHHKLIEKAKEKLSTTELSVSEVAYRLGFEHPQSFSKLFKQKTKMSPSVFRESFRNSN